MCIVKFEQNWFYIFEQLCTFTRYLQIGNYLECMISHSKDSKTIVEASLSTNVTGKLTYVLQFSGSQKNHRSLTLVWLETNLMLNYKLSLFQERERKSVQRVCVISTKTQQISQGRQIQPLVLKCPNEVVGGGSRKLNNWSDILRTE